MPIKIKIGSRMSDPERNIRFYRKGVQDALEPVSMEHVERREAVTANWSNLSQPAFTSTVEVQGNTTRLLVFARERNPNKPIWMWLDKTATAPHVITPKTVGGVLAFPWGGAGSYSAKTTPGKPSKFNGTGAISNAQQSFFTFVNHPGFEPRHFTVTINRSLRKKELKAIKEGGINGLS